MGAEAFLARSLGFEAFEGFRSLGLLRQKKESNRVSGRSAASGSLGHVHRIHSRLGDSSGFLRRPTWACPSGR